MPLYIKPVPEEVSTFVKENFRYDKDTGTLWRMKTSKIVGSSNSQGYLDVDLGKPYKKRTRNTRVHRVAWFLSYGEWPEGQIDHINGDKKDNRLENLRLTDQQKNQHNRFSRKNSSSVYKGVGLHRGKWRSYITDLEGKFKGLGYFENETLAAEAYDNAAKELFGSWARLNFPDEKDVSAVRQDKDK